MGECAMEEFVMDQWIPDQVQHSPMMRTSAIDRTDQKQNTLHLHLHSSCSIDADQSASDSQHRGMMAYARMPFEGQTLTQAAEQWK